MLVPPVILVLPLEAQCVSSGLQLRPSSFVLTLQGMLFPCRQLQMPLALMNARKVGYNRCLLVNLFQNLEDTRVQECPARDAYHALRVYVVRANDPVNAIRKMPIRQFTTINHAQEDNSVTIIKKTVLSEETFDAFRAFTLAEG